MYKSHPRQQFCCCLGIWSVCLCLVFHESLVPVFIMHLYIVHVPAVDLEGDFGLVEFAWAWECDLGLAVSAVTWKWILHVCVCISYAHVHVHVHWYNNKHLPSIDVDSDLGRAESTGVQCHIFKTNVMLTNYMYIHMYMYTNSMQVKVKQSEMVWTSKMWCDYAEN